MKSTLPREQFPNCSKIQRKNFKAKEVQQNIFQCLKFLTVACIFTAFFSFSSFGQTDDFNQAENDNGAPGSHTINWINGILNSTHTDYFEGHSVPQRHIFTNLGAGQHTLKIKFLTKKDVQHAYDFLTSWQQAYDAAAYYGNGSVNELGRLFTDECRNNSSVSAQGQAACAGLVSSAFVLNPVIPDGMGNGPFPASADIDGKIQIYENSAKGATGFGERTIQIRGSKAISNASVSFTGYDGDYATYSIVWTNSASGTNILIRYAGHLAMGSGAGGYGVGLGAGSVNGGPYHFKFQNLYNAAGGSIFGGDQDNQIMSNAIQIPPSCTLQDGTSGCPETNSFSFSYSSANAANATLKFYFITNTANATMGAISGTGSCSSNFFQATANSSGNYILNVGHGAGTFTPAGSFRIGVCAVTTNGTATCEQSTATTIDNVSMVARVDNTATTAGSPFVVNANTASPSATLSALATLNGSQNNALFTNFSWSVASSVPGNEAVAGNLANSTTATATFTPTLKSPGPGYQPGLYAFDVTAESIPNGCDVTARVYINVTSGANCPSDITGPTPVCSGTAGLVYSSASLANNVDFPEPGLTYTWSIDPVGAATITSSAVNVSQVTVTAGTQNFGVRVTVTNANNEVFFNSGCQFNVTLNTDVALTSLTNATKCPGENASFTSTASGSGATGADIRWYKVDGGETQINTGITVDGLNSTLALTNVSSADAGTYRARIGGAPLCGNDSKDGTLTVKDNVALTSLTNATKCPGETATFTSTASGTDATGADVGWYKVASGVETLITTGITVDGQNSTLTLTNVSSADAGTYRAKIGGAPLCGNDSKDGTLTVKDNVALTSLTNVARCPGETATFTSTASGTDATGADIKWYKVVSGVETEITTGINASGQSSTLTISNISAGDAATYRAKIGGAPLCGNDAKDGVLTLANCAHIFPTQTTCCNYLGGNPSDFQLLNVCTTVASGKISNAIPGVFFYYADYTATATGAVSLVVRQSRNTANNVLKPFDPQNSNNVRVFVDNCLSISPTSVQLGNGGNAGNVTINFNAVSGKKYVISVKYDTKSIIGSNAPAGTALYTFEILKGGNLVSGTTGELSVVANCVDNTPAPYGVCPSNLIASGRPILNDVNEPLDESDISISAFPNPYQSVVNFKFASPKTGKAVLEVFDILGRKLAVVYQGYVTANTPVNVKYNVPALNRVSLIYKLSVDKESVLGKVFPEKK